MNITAVPFLRLYKLHMEVIKEMNLCEQSTSQLNIQVEKEQDFLWKKLEQVIQEKDQIAQDHQNIKEVVEETCKDIPSLDV